MLNVAIDALAAAIVPSSLYALACCGLAFGLQIFSRKNKLL